MTGTASLIKKLARRNVTASPSVVTGSLRDAIISKKIPKSQTPYASEHIVTVRGRSKRGKKLKNKQSIAPHARYVEFGTVNMPAEPFLAPAFDHGKKEATDKMIEKIRRRLDQVRPK